MADVMAALSAIAQEMAAIKEICSTMGKGMEKPAEEAKPEDEEKPEGEKACDEGEKHEGQKSLEKLSDEEVEEELEATLAELDAIDADAN